MNMKLHNEDSDKTLMMNVWFTTFIESGCSQTALEKADKAVYEFEKRFLSVAEYNFNEEK